MRTLKRLIKLTVSLLLYCGDSSCAALAHLAGRKPRSRCVVLYYHGVDAGQRRDFAKQIHHLRRLALPISAQRRVESNARGHYCAVTFDDGFVSVLDNAVPELERHDIPATLFIPTGSLGKRPQWIKDTADLAAGEQVMSVPQLISLQNHRLITIGSHSVSHPNFTKLDQKQAAMELRESKARLESILGREVASFSFPHGACTDRDIELARSAGYHRLFTISPEAPATLDQSFVLGRVAVSPDDWDLEFRLKILGAYRWLAKLPRRRSTARSAMSPGEKKRDSLRTEVQVG